MNATTTTTRQTAADLVIGDVFKTGGMSRARMTGKTTFTDWSLKTNSYVEVDAISTEQQIGDTWITGKPVALTQRVIKE